MIQDTVKSYMLNPAPGSMLRELADVEAIRVWHDQALIKAHRPRIILRTGPLERRPNRRPEPEPRPASAAVSQLAAETS